MPRKPVFQQHHISYKPEWKGTVFKKEHNVLDGRMGMNRWTSTSKFFITALKDWILKHEGEAVDLDAVKK